MSKKIPLVEMFGPTIQGEGAVIGQQTYFMRFGLCDYKCKMCDSMNAVDPMQVKANATFLTPLEIANTFSDTMWMPGSTKWITLSGGNPCIHDLTDMIIALKAERFKFAVETQGTFAPGWLRECDVITVSPKGPGMGEDTSLEQLDKFMTACHMYGVSRKTNIKVVVFDQRDLEFAKMLWERYRHNDVPFYLSLGNPYPPGMEFNSDILNAITSGVESDQHKALHMGRLISVYKMLFQDIQNDPVLSSMRFLPQWHVFVWGNQKGK